MGINKPLYQEQVDLKPLNRGSAAEIGAEAHLCRMHCSACKELETGLFTTTKLIQTRMLEAIGYPPTALKRDD